MKKIFALMAAALSLAACSTNDVADITHDDADNVVNVASATRNANAAAEDMTAPFHLINITQRTKNSVNFEADFTHNGSAYTPTDGKKVVWYNGTDANGNEIENEFEAFSPLTTPYNLASSTYFHLPTDQSTAELLASADWMTASDNKKKSAAENGAITLNFDHKLSKLHFDIIAKADATAMGSSNFKVINSSITPYYNNSSTSTTIEAIVEPRDDAYTTNDEIINIMLGSETFSLPFPNDITFAPGKQYNFTLNLGHDAVAISQVSVTDWDPATITTNDDQAFNESGIDYVTFTANSEQGFKFEVTTENSYHTLLPIEGFEYSVDNGPWIAIPGTGMTDFVTFGGNKGDLRLRGKSINNTGTCRRGENEANGHATVTFREENVKVTCTGDIRTLIDYENHFVETNNARFMYLFKNCTQLTSAPKLPATDLADYCYGSMFQGCTSLATAPELPATTLASACYNSMFANCSALTTAPEELPATELAVLCYLGMFSGCTSLKSAPKLPATDLADNCYAYMFKGCILLDTAPELPATTLATKCYWFMFNGCTSLTKAPELPAQTLENNCYKEIFSGCIKISEIKMLAPPSQINTDTMDGWLNYVGTDGSVTSRTLILYSQDAYNKLKNERYLLPHKEWKVGYTNTTVKDKDGKAITDD